MLPLVFLTLFGALLPGGVSSEGQPKVLAPAAPSDVGMSQTTLDSAATLYVDAVARGDIAGVVLLVARHGKIVLHRAFGWSDRENHVPMTTATPVDIASMTKPLIATVTLALAERGQLRLDDPIDKYIPEFKTGRSHLITIRHLLDHTSGLQIPLHFVDPAGPRPSETPTGSSLRAEVALYPLIGPSTEPGRTYSYSNPGYNTLGAVLEVASGESLPELLRDPLYAPLGMTSTFQLFGDPPPTTLARQYIVKDDTLALFTPRPYPFAIGSGRTASTALDYARFCQMYLNGGALAGRRVLSTADVARATAISVRTRYVFPDSQQLAQRGLKPRWYYRLDGRGTGLATGYGLGWAVADNGIYFHPGVTGTFAWIDPSRDLIGVILTQCNDARNPGIEFMGAVNAAVDRSRP